MIKFSLILFNIFGVLFANIFGADEISIEHRLPISIAKGDKQLVEITIAKGSLKGFAKLEVVIPPGFVATAGTTLGASFTFSEQEATFVWFDMPSEDAITVSYYLEAATVNEGSFTFKGTFSRIKENVRVDQSLADKSVKVLPAGEVVEATSNYVPATETVTPVDAAIQTASTETSSPEVASTNSQPVATEGKILLPNPSNEIICVRTITKISATEARVDLKIVNDNVTGFVKVLETLPGNCSPVKVADAGSVVTIDENVIKFFWFDVPMAPELTLSYKMTCLSAYGDEPALTGKLSYIYNNNPVERPVVSAGSVIEPLADNGNPNEPDTTNTNTTNNNDTATNIPPKVETPPVKENPKTTTTEPKTTKPPKTTSVPNPETGVTYKVQIMAAHKVVGRSYFLSHHEYEAEFALENHEGWVKYTTGQYNEYKHAHDRRDELKVMYSTLRGPFVTAYNNGDRITVQEALLISKQQWYQ